MNPLEGQTLEKTEATKAPYAKPILARHGAVARRTQGGSHNGNDGGQGHHQWKP
mgnify:CR=1 FL=1